MAAIKTVMTYPLNSSTVNFNIPFEYLARKFITITLIGKDRKVLVLNQDYRFTTKTQVTTTRAWGPGDGYTSIEVRRYTSATDRLVDFADGSILRAYDLNISQVQTLHVAEEARDLTADTIGVNNDGNLDARGRRIVNLANAADRGDAISYGQVLDMSNGAYQSAQNAAAQAQEATRQQQEATRQAGISSQQAQASAQSAAASQTSRVASEGARDASVTARDLAQAWASRAVDNPVVTGLFSAFHWASKAAASAAQSLGFRDTTKTYMDNAAGSATTATQQADRAKTEADKLGNNNAFAGAIKSVNTTTNAVEMKGDFTVPTLYAHTVHVDNNLRVKYGKALALTPANDASEINVSNVGDRLQFNYSGPMRYVDFNNLDLLNVHSANLTDGGLSARTSSDPVNPAIGTYLNTPGLQVGWRGRGNDNSTAYGYTTLYAQEKVGEYWAGVLTVGGYGTNASFYFYQTGRFRAPADVEAGGTVRASNVVVAGNEVWAGGGSGKMVADGNIYGPAWGGWLSDWVTRNAMTDAGRGGQQFRGGAMQSAWEAPAGCFLTGTNTNYNDGRILGSYFRQFIGRKINGGQFGIGDFA